MEEIINQLIAYARDQGLGAGSGAVVGIVLGFFAPKFIPQLQALAARTPTRLDDLAVKAFAACLKASEVDLARISMAELNRHLSTAQIKELVTLRKEQILAEGMLRKNYADDGAAAGVKP